MCGICGFAAVSPSIPAMDLQRMNETLFRRGPDAHGFHVGDGVGLAMRRLSIIDLAGGHQPVWSYDRRYVAVFNGEIFNYAELRAALIRDGHQFYSRGDAEVIVNQFAAQGLRGLSQLRGMYAIALWDTLEKALWLVRDPLGIKPLFYATVDGGVVFGSEIKAILASGRIGRDIDPQALDAYLAYGYVPPPASIYQAIRKLEPGQALRCHAGEIAHLGHRRLLDDLGTASTRPIDFAEEIRQSVRYHMVSDVPVGIFLSGGLDSSAITVQMQALSKEPIEAFTVRFQEPRSHLVDETPAARELQFLHGFRLHEQTVDLDMDRVLPEVLGAFDEPFADDSVFPSYEVCRIASASLKVCVSGAGGDELFGGYNRYQGLALQAMLDRRISGKLQGVLPPFGRLLGRAVGLHTRRGDLLKRFSDNLGQPLDQTYLGYISSTPVSERLSLYVDGFRRRIDPVLTSELVARHLRAFPRDDVVGAAMYADTQTYLCEDVLALADRVGMWHSLEIRVPLADIVLARQAFSLCSSQHVDHRRKKKVLRAAIREWVPPDLLRRPKQGFESPMAIWLRGATGLRFEQDLERPPAAWEAIIETQRVRELLRLHRAAKGDHAKILFSLLVLFRWIRGVESPSSVQTI